MKNKNVVLGIIAALGVFSVSAQDIDPNTVPVNLKTNFAQSYPTANDVEWELDGSTYKVEFEVDRQDHEIWYTLDGTTTKTEQELTEADLPQAIKTAIASNYAEYNVDDVEMTTENGAATYKVELRKGWNDEKDVVFSDGGKVLSENND